MRKYIFILCVMIGGWITSTVQAAIEVSSTRLTVADGLANNSVRYIYQDDKGFIWFGTLDGLNRYDGSSFLTFQMEKEKDVSLADHRVRYLEEDGNGFLWIRYTTSLYSCYDLRKGTFVDFTGCGEHMFHYAHIYIPEHADEDVWLWGSENGCRKVTCKDGVLSSVAFRKGKGLGSDVVNDLKADGQGGAWIATSAGLYHWDGKELSSLLAGNDILYVQVYHGKAYFFSSQGEVYVSVGGGVALVDKVSMRKNVRFEGNISYGNKWAFFTNIENYCFDFIREKFVLLDKMLDIHGVQIIEDNQQDYWIYNDTGKLRYVQVETGEIKIFQVMPETALNYIDEERYSIIHDSRGLLWIATYGNGLFVYDPHSSEMRHFTTGEQRYVDSPISSDYLLCLMEDRLGNIWVSSEFTGIDKLSIINEGAFCLYPNGEGQMNRSNAIRFISCLDGADIYATTRTGDVLHYDSTFNHCTKEKLNSNIYAIEKDADGTIWHGTRGRGLWIGDAHYIYRSSDATSLSSNQVYCILRDSKERMWIGTFGGGLNLAVRDADGTYHFRRFFQAGGEEARIRSLCEDSNGWIWVGTSRGVCVFRPEEFLENGRCYRYGLENGDLYSNEIRSVFSDSKGYVWIAETGSGFSYCLPGEDYSQLKFTHYGVTEGLVNNMVQTFVEDLHGSMWISTEYGISCFNPESKLFENHFFSANVLGNIYSENCGIRLPDGRLAFGTNYGLTVIDPEAVRQISHNPQVIFTDLKLNGISVQPDSENSPLNFAMPYLSELHLRYFQNSFSIDFSTMDYTRTGDQQFSFKLEGYDKAWSAPSTLNFVAYKNLEPGTYRLHVKARNALGIWNENASVLKIVITPPFWKTGWAYLAYVILIGGILYVCISTLAKMNLLRTQIKLDQQLTEYKLRFFTNISHEFRTPLTLIQNALEKIHHAGDIPPDMDYPIKVMDKSTLRMLRLINELLEFRKMQNNKLTLALERMDVIAYLHEIYLSFKEIAESKSMVFNFISSVEHYQLYIDKEKVDKIVYNLLSNAFKYTPAKGKVELRVSVDENTHWLMVCVADTGVGVPKEKQDELFTRFMSNRFSHNSIGIGLHLTYELVLVHKGIIYYKENPEGGSLFIVSLPTEASAYEEKDFLIQDNVLLREEQEAEKGQQESGDLPLPSVTEPAGADKEEFVFNEALRNRKLLVVEDDNDVREYLRRELGMYFEIVAEPDGESGLERAKSYDADLIISDVMLPGCSGFELTKRLKNNFETSHIPIILLTALSSDENHVEGIDCGADAYITKPFSMKLLLTRISRLIEQRDKLRERFSNEPGLARTTVCTDSRDKRFADKLVSLVEARISNPALSVDELLAEFGLGRSVFYRKVRGVTGYSPAEYIRMLRMKKAAELLLQTDMNVTEVSREVGINDPFYFSKCFKAQFGVTPSVYQKNNGQTDESLGMKNGI